MHSISLHRILKTHRVRQILMTSSATLPPGQSYLGRSKGLAMSILPLPTPASVKKPTTLPTHSQREVSLKSPNIKSCMSTLAPYWVSSKLSLSAFKRQGSGGSTVLISSATAYTREHNLPVYSATKLGVICLIRSLRSAIPHTHGATINSVAPSATMIRLLPAEFLAPLLAARAPISTVAHMGLAVAYSATATQTHGVEPYGQATQESVARPGKWNGRTILTFGNC